MVTATAVAALLGAAVGCNHGQNGTDVAAEVNGHKIYMADGSRFVTSTTNPLHLGNGHN